jgi:hypothetical protein
MLLSTSIFTIQFSDLRDFSFRCKWFDCHMQREVGEPFWSFDSRRWTPDSLDLWGFGAHLLIHRLSPGQYTITHMP